MPTFCIPTLSSLPDAPAADFDWWSSPPNPALLRYYPDNPNWLGAFSLSQGNGANRDILFRALRGVLGGTDYLLMQWVVRTSANDPAIDRVNVLLGVPGGNYLAFSANLDSAASVVAGTQNGGTFVYRVRGGSASGGTVTLSGAENTSTGDIETTGRMWVDVTSPTRLIQTRWAFQVAIPLGANWGGGGLANQLNIPASGAFKLWFEINTSLGPGMAAIPQAWPQGAPTTTSAFQIIPSGGIAEASMFDLSTAGAGCTDAVKLVSTNVGTRNVDGSARPDINTIMLDLGKAYPPLSATPYDTNHTPNVSNAAFQNQFFAIPTFPGGMSVAQKESVRATFSLANWGSQWWTPVASPPPDSWKPIPGGTDTQFINTNGECHFAWPTAGEPTGPTSFVTKLVRNINKYLNAWMASVPFPSDSQNPHQCMLVELSSVDPGVVITTSSVFTNMNVARASTFRRFAEISVKGAPPISVQPRDVYLYVQKFNMPAIASKDDKPPVNEFNVDRASFAAAGRPRSNDVEDIAAFVPTYTVHGYVDTGRTYELKDGRKVPVLEPQTAFGYFVLHEGDLHGWETRLYGAEKLADNLYIVRVPNNGSVHVETAIQARENPNEAPLPPDGKPEYRKPQGCLAWLLGWGWGKKH